jgi:hypothetical protein
LWLRGLTAGVWAAKVSEEAHLSLNRHAKRRDRNEPELVKLAKSLGAYLYRTDKPGDWLLGFRGTWIVVEIKGEDGSPTPDQIAFSREARARRLPYWTWRTDEDVMRDLGARRAA